MIINGLGFTGRKLYMYSEYFEDKLLERLMAPGIDPEHINDDALGRCLDAIYEKGVSFVYQTLGEAVVKHLDLPYDSVHLDSMSFHYDGQGRHKDVTNAHPLVIQNILSHLNTKDDEVVELLPPQSRTPPQISLFE
jgi:transposase